VSQEYDTEKYPEVFEPVLEKLISVLSPDLINDEEREAFKVGLEAKREDIDRFALASEDIAFGTTLTIAKLITSKRATTKTTDPIFIKILDFFSFVVSFSMILNYIIINSYVKWYIDFATKLVYNVTND